ncbi:MAG: response regulator [Candidatus Sericytochromatia bacterium]|nr:response regulator [Candidatus Sericytochromatia bacterium]
MYKIVIIEDDDVIRENLYDILNHHSFLVEAFDDGSLALKSIKENLPDLILCDIMMPKISGYEILKNIQESNEFKSIPFIFLTAKVETADMRLGMNMGADDYLTKPFTTKDLITTINLRLEKVENQKKEELKTLKHKLDNLNKIIGHEYNTPLNGIIGLSDLLLSSFDNFDKTEIHKYIECIKESGIRLKDTNDKLIDFISYLNDIKTLAPDIISIKELKEITINILKDASKKNNRISDLNILNIDRSYKGFIAFPTNYLIKIIKEITANAFKFSSAYTPITLDFLIIDKHYISINIINHGVLDYTSKGSLPKINNYENGETDFGVGLFIINRLCAIQNCSFSIAENSRIRNQNITATLKIKYLY